MPPPTPADGPSSEPEVSLLSACPRQSIHCCGPVPRTEEVEAFPSPGRPCPASSAPPPATSMYYDEMCHAYERVPTGLGWEPMATSGNAQEAKSGAEGEIRAKPVATPNCGMRTTPCTTRASVRRSFPTVLRGGRKDGAGSLGPAPSPCRALPRRALPWRATPSLATSCRE